MLKSKRKISNINNKIELIFIFSIIATICLSYYWSSLKETISFSDISISRTSILSESTYERFILNLKDTNKSFFKIINNSIETHPYIKAARVSKHFPNKILIELIERKPIAFLKAKDLLIATIDIDGFILPIQGNIRNFNLPVMSNINPDPKFYPNGKKVLSKKVEECISWLALINKKHINLYDNISEINMTSLNEIEIILYDHPTNIYLGQKNFISRIGTLIEFQKVLHPKQLSDFAYLDMRYKNQIIAKERKS